MFEKIIPVIKEQSHHNHTVDTMNDSGNGESAKKLNNRLRPGVVIKFQRKTCHNKQHKCDCKNVMLEFLGGA